jgi:Spy/CpxP family protein refolding chaperone
MTREVKTIVLSLVFALGVATGALGLRLSERASGGSAEGRGGRFDRARYVSRLTKDLRLTADQGRQLDRILDDTRADFMKVRETIQPQIQEIKRRARGRIREMLNPDQQERFEAFLKEWDAEKERRSER